MSEKRVNWNSALVTRPDPQCQQAARRYAHDRQRAGLLVFPALLVLVAILGTPSVTRALRDKASSVSGDPGVVVGLYVLFVVTLVLVCILPGEYAFGYALPHKYGLTQMKVGAWWVRYAGSVIWTLVSCLVIGEVFYWIARTVTGWWWLVDAILWSAAILLLNGAWPSNRFGFRRLEVLNDPEIECRLARLTEQGALPHVSIRLLPADERRRVANVWLIGLGRRSRIVLSETMLNNINYDEIETLLAHELAHLKHADLPKALALRILAIFAGSFLGYLLAKFLIGPAFAGPADVAILPYLLIYCSGVWFLTAMLDGLRSRKAESSADRYAIALTGRPEPFRSAMIKLADLNLVEMHPNSRTKDLSPKYPTAAERIAGTEVRVVQPASDPTSSDPSSRKTTDHVRPKRRTVRRIGVRETSSRTHQ